MGAQFGLGGDAGDVPRLEQGESTEQFVEVIVGAKPDPDDGVAASLADRPVLFVDAHGPDVVVAAQFLEPKRGMARIAGELGVGPAGSLPRPVVQPGVSCARSWGGQRQLELSSSGV